MRVSVTMDEAQYFIDIDSSNHTLYRQGYNEKTQQNNEVFLGHFTKMDNAVDKIVKDLAANNPNTVTLYEFLEEYRSIKKQIQDLVTI